MGVTAYLGNRIRRKMQKEGGRYALNRICCPKSPIADGWECAKKHLGLPPSVFFAKIVAFCILRFLSNFVVRSRGGDFYIWVLTKESPRDIITEKEALI